MHELIEHKVLDSTTATVTFSNIPDIYEDLLLVASGRTTYTSTLDSNMRLRFNNDATASYIVEAAYGNGASGAQFRNTYDHIYGGFVPSAIATASTFSSSKIRISNYAKSITKEVSIENVHENNASTAYIGLIHALWNKTTPITEIDIYTNNNPYVQHSSFTLYGVGRKAGIGRQPLASGGYTSFVDGYWVHTFTANGSFKPFVDLDVEYLVVAGGGAGGYDRGSGGGAGGYRSSIAGESSGGGASAESLLSLSGNTNYSVTVGAGGATHTGYTAGNSGSNSTFSTITSLGGGAGRFGSTNTGTNGGSGSGAPSQGGGPHPAGLGTTGQGFDGGNSGVGTGGSGGGGGAGGVGRPGENNNGQAGAGGPGVPSNVTGSLVYRAGGGGGGAAMDFSAPRGGGAGGIGGGGAGGNTNGADGEAGTVNTGGGGGGGANISQGDGGAGGSGIVIVRYRA